MGSVAFVIGSALTGKLVTMLIIGDPRAVNIGRGIHAARLSHPSDDSATRGKPPAGEHRLVAWLALVLQNWRFLACVCLLQGAHAAYYGFSAIYWQAAGYSASAVGYLWSLGVVAEVIIFALSDQRVVHAICC